MSRAACCPLAWCPQIQPSTKPGAWYAAVLADAAGATADSTRCAVVRCPGCSRVRQSKNRCVVCSSVMPRVHAGASVDAARCAAVKMSSVPAGATRPGVLCRAACCPLARAAGATVDIARCVVQGSRGCIRRHSQVCSSEMSSVPVGAATVRLGQVRGVQQRASQGDSGDSSIVQVGCWWGWGGVCVGGECACGGGGGGRGGTCTTTVACTDWCLNVSIPARQPGEPWR